MKVPHIAGYAAVLSDAIERAVDECHDLESDGVSASDLAYIYQTIRPGSDTGAAQDTAHAMFWRLVYRRMIGADTPLRGVNLDTVDIPEQYLPSVEEVGA